MSIMTAAVAKMEVAQSPVSDQTIAKETPLDVLKEYRPGMKFDVIPSATPGTKVTVHAELDGHEFHGVGDDYDMAVQRASLEVITYLYSLEEIAFGVEKYNRLMEWKPQTDPQSTDTLSTLKAATCKNASPLMVFNQLFQKSNPEWAIAQRSVMPSQFEATLKVNDKTFVGVETTKKLARQKAAEAALSDIHGFSMSTLLTPTSAKKRRLEDVAARDSSPKWASPDGDAVHTPTPPKRKRKQTEGGTPVFPESKNPLQILNEFKRGIVFNTVSQEGPSHAPKITMECEVDGQTFQAVSTSKQKAKLQLGQSVVQYFQDLGQLQLSPSLPNEVTTETPPSAIKTPQATAGGMQKTPLMMLYELTKNQLPCEVLEYEENKTKRFVAKYTINEKTYEGEGLSKQRAKHRAAEIILRDVYGIHVGNKNTNGELNASGAGDAGGSTDIRMLQFADRVRRAIMEKWRSLCDSRLSEENAKRKVIAGVVMTKDAEQMEVEPTDDNETGETKAVEDLPDLFAEEDLLCITTGTKCLGGEFINAHGTVLNDCHAEVLSARCLRHILYRHIELIVNGEDSNILEVRKSDNGFALREGVRLHLYISTAPCGDARIFCPHELGSLTGDSHPGRRSRGLLRTKIESGEGTIPVVVNGSGMQLQTFDGVVQGERLLTMSCSDKLCLWNVIGIQGALLSRLLAAPIYFDTVILGSVFVDSHIERALYERAASIDKPILEPFKATRPTFLVTTERDERQPRKSPGISVVWIAMDETEDLEVIVASRGKQDGDKLSRLCKQSLFSRFCKLEEQLPWLKEGRTRKESEHTQQMYAEAKQEAKEYQETKRLLQQHFKLGGFGSWVRRPIEQDLFELAE